MQLSASILVRQLLLIMRYLIQSVKPQLTHTHKQFYSSYLIITTTCEKCQLCLFRENIRLRKFHCPSYPVRPDTEIIQTYKFFLICHLSKLRLIDTPLREILQVERYCHSFINIPSRQIKK